MSGQLGKIERLEVDHFKHGKKLYLVPIVYSGEGGPDEYKSRCDRYWQQVEEQLTSLASRIGMVNRVYHESVFESGMEGMKAVEELNLGSYRIAKTQCDNGATFEAIEERELFEEAMDWQRCLTLGFMSEKVASRVSEFYVEATRKRNELMARKIGETLKDDEAGLLFIREGHSVQFPLDVEVFSIFPPALDELHRWLRDRVTPSCEESATESKEEGEQEVEEAENETEKTKGRD